MRRYAPPMETAGNAECERQQRQPKRPPRAPIDTWAATPDVLSTGATASLRDLTSKSCGSQLSRRPGWMVGRTPAVGTGGPMALPIPRAMQVTITLSGLRLQPSVAGRATYSGRYRSVRRQRSVREASRIAAQVSQSLGAPVSPTRLLSQAKRRRPRGRNAGALERREGDRHPPSWARYRRPGAGSRSDGAARV
jgi:hypothetical protein